MKKFLFSIFLILSSQLQAQEITVDIAGSDKATTDSIAAVANDLMTELKKAGSFEFRMENDGRRGRRNKITFVLTSVAEKENLPFPRQLIEYNPEGFYTRSNDRQVTFVGNTVLALQHAAFDYLEQLGFRYFQPGVAWHIVPTLSSPFIAYEKISQPLYEFRQLANGQGFYRNKKVENDFNFWARANRLGGSFPIRTGMLTRPLYPIMPMYSNNTPSISPGSGI